MNPGGKASENLSEELKALRLLAEEFLISKKNNDNSHLYDAETIKLFHELEVYQIELELQHEELLQTRKLIAEYQHQKATDITSSDSCNNEPSPLQESKSMLQLQQEIALLHSILDQLTHQLHQQIKTPLLDLLHFSNTLAENMHHCGSDEIGSQISIMSHSITQISKMLEALLSDSSQRLKNT